MKIAKRIGIVIALIALLLAVTLFSSLWIEPLRIFVPTRVLEMFFLYDHIIYNGVPYYFCEYEKVGDGIIPDFDREISIEMVSSSGRSYGKNKVDSAYLCENDDGQVYIYFGTWHYTKDRSLACEP